MVETIYSSVLEELDSVRDLVARLDEQSADHENNDDLLAEGRVRLDRIQKHLFGENRQSQSSVDLGNVGCNSSSELWQTFVENAPDYIVIVDSAGTIQFINRVATGFNIDEVVGKTTIFDHIDSKHHDAIKKALTAAFDHGEAAVYEAFSPGVQAWFVNYLCPMNQEGSERSAILLSRDITERRAADQLLNQTIERLELAVHGATDGIWDYNIATEDGYWSPSMYELLGYKDGEISAHYETLRSLIHPDDFERVDTTVDQHLYENESFEIELRMRHKLGHDIWVQCLGEAIRDENGAPVRMAGVIRNITERKQAEQLVTDRENLYREAIAISDSVAYQVDASFQSYTHMGQGIERLLGYQASEFTPSFWKQIVKTRNLRGQSANLTFPEAIKQFQAGVLKNWQVDYECVTKEGKSCWLADSAVLIHDEQGHISGCLGILQNITERKRTTDLLTEMNIALSNATPGISRLDTQGQYVEVNYDYAYLLGYEPEELIGTAWDATVHTDDMTISVEAYERMCREGKSEFEVRAIRKDGSQFHKQVLMIKIVDSNGAITGHHCFMRDISGRVEAAFAARKHQEEMAHASRIVTMGEMGTGIAHELNQPLAAIATYSFILRGKIGQLEGNQSDLVEMLERLEKQALRAGDVVRQLRRYIKKTPPSWELTEINSLVRDAANFVNPVVNQAEASLILNLDEPTLKASVDPIQIQQVLVNLVKNAIDAMEEIPSEKRVVHISTHLNQNRLIEVSVNDNGTGISEDELNSIFETFYTTKHNGLGMGLAISRSILERHGGSLWAEPNEGPGTTFRFTIPNGLINEYQA